MKSLGGIFDLYNNLPSLTVNLPTFPATSYMTLEELEKYIKNLGAGNGSGTGKRGAYCSDVMGLSCGSPWNFLIYDKVTGSLRRLTTKDYDNGTNFTEWSLFVRWIRAGGVCPRGDGVERAENAECSKGCTEERNGGYFCA